MPTINTDVITLPAFVVKGRRVQEEDAGGNMRFVWEYTRTLLRFLWNPNTESFEEDPTSGGETTEITPHNEPPVPLPETEPTPSTSNPVVSVVTSGQFVVNGSIVENIVFEFADGTRKSFNLIVGDDNARYQFVSGLGWKKANATTPGGYPTNWGASGPPPNFAPTSPGGGGIGGEMD